MEKITENHPLSGSQDIIANNIQKLKEIFPEIFSEGRVDFEKLQLLLSDLISPKDDLYGLNWWGKTEAIKESMKRSFGTLRPDKESSKNWDITENLYIEGDNLEVLKLLQKSYTGKVKMIYIDPPYNTGKDFVYKDNYKDNLKNYLEQTGQVDSDGVKQSTNTKDDGRYHSNWLNMMYPRLKLARNLLKDDGVIFISIDDNEVYNLIEIANEIFGENNFITILKWNKTSTPPSLSKKIRHKYEFILCYEKHRDNIEYNGGISEGGDMPLLNEGNRDSIIEIPADCISFNFDGLYIKGIYDRVELIEDIRINNGKSDRTVKLKGPFKWTQLNLENEIKEGTTFIIKSEKFAIRYIKDGLRFKKPADIISKHECGVGTNEDAGKDVEALFGVNIMSFPKPVNLIKYLSKFKTTSNDIIVDFFSGSGTTAEAILKLNSEDGCDRKYICVQIPEKISETEIAFDFLQTNNKPTRLTEIGKERIRRAGDKILTEKKEELEQLKSKSSLIQTEEEKIKIEELEQIIKNLDIGFKVFKLDSSNIEAWNTEMPETEGEIKKQLEFSRNHLLKGRTEEDLLYELLLKQGLMLTSPIEERAIAGAKVYNVNYGELFICMNTPINMQLIEGIGAWGKDCMADAIVDLKPVLVLKDEAFGSDDAFKTNTELRLLNEFGFAKVNTL